MANLLALKPLKQLLEETHESGEHSLKRTLGVLQLTALGVGAIIGAGIFVMAGLGAHYAGPGLMLSFVLSGLGKSLRGPLLCGIRRHDSSRRQRLHLCLRHAGRDFCVDHRLGSDAGIRHGSEHGIVRLVKPLHRASQYLPPENPSVAGVRSLDGPADRRRHDRPADGAGFRCFARLERQAFLEKCLVWHRHGALV